VTSASSQLSTNEFLSLSHSLKIVMFPPEILNGTLSSQFRSFLILRRCIGRTPGPPGKPPLLPPARSKRYTIIHVPWQPAEDAKELLWRRHIYNDALASYRAMYKRMNEEQMKGAMGQEAIQRREDEEFEQVLKENDQENRRIAQQRKTRIDERIRLVEESTLKEIDTVVNSEQQALRDREAEVLAMVERSKDFITLENMEQKILDALENPKEYNYAIDINGNVYQGDVYLKYLSETPLAAVPVSEITAPLRKVGKLEEGTGKILDADEKVSASA